MLQPIENLFDWAIMRLVWRKKEQEMAALVNNMAHQGICM
jgi:hypothetical protein